MHALPESLQRDVQGICSPPSTAGTQPGRMDCRQLNQWALWVILS